MWASGLASNRNAGQALVTDPIAVDIDHPPLSQMTVDRVERQNLMRRCVCSVCSAPVGLIEEADRRTGQRPGSSDNGLRLVQGRMVCTREQVAQTKLIGAADATVQSFFLQQSQGQLGF